MSLSDDACPGIVARLLHLPAASTFTCVMGTTGLGLVWRSSSTVLKLPAIIGEVILIFSVLLFLFLLSGYLARALFLPDQWRKEWHDNVGACLTGAITISGLLIAAAILPYSLRAAFILWATFAVAQLGLSLILLGRWIREPMNMSQVLPVWLIPMVGNAMAVFAGAPLGYIEISWLMLTIGFFAWLFLSPILLIRLIAHPQKLPAPTLPTLFIIASPPAITSIAWYYLTAQTDLFFTCFAFIALFFTLVFLCQIRWILSAPFSRAWWSLTFPNTALASSMMLYHRGMHTMMSTILAWTTLTAVSGILLLVWLMAIKSGIYSLLKPYQADGHSARKDQP